MIVTSPVTLSTSWVWNEIFITCSHHFLFLGFIKFFSQFFQSPFCFSVRSKQTNKKSLNWLLEKIYIISEIYNTKMLLHNTLLQWFLNVGKLETPVGLAKNRLRRFAVEHKNEHFYTFPGDVNAAGLGITF